MGREAHGEVVRGVVQARGGRVRRNFAAKARRPGEEEDEGNAAPRPINPVEELDEGVALLRCSSSVLRRLRSGGGRRGGLR